MLCYECGYQDSTINGPHTCSEADLKRAAKRRSAGAAPSAQSMHDSWVWPAAFWATVVMAVIIAAMNLARLVVLSREYSAVSGLGDPPTAAQIANLINADHAVRGVASFGWLTFMLYFVVLAVWSVVTRRMMRALGVSPAELRHWSGTVAGVGLAVLLVVMFATRQTAVATNLASLRAAALRVVAGQIIYTLLGIGFAGLLIVKVRALRERLTELTREKEEARLDRERAAAARALAPAAEGPAAP
ncbi:hypothetical protein [Rugosimonospora africana]|uniref:Uncharacterized protein n=1 Tax=Rugosimonospora africana TaxID=556532 RepID=A0A8J3VUD1_9ACTN|nr:hypothetical protein [Rugosimonospora africana]GIH18864.1 hypothetical protein Raf01_70360 [Rugosimonospora africana]